jgi:hypothetical protein
VYTISAKFLALPFAVLSAKSSASFLDSIITGSTPIGDVLHAKPVVDPHQESVSFFISYPAFPIATDAAMDLKVVETAASVLFTILLRKVEGSVLRQTGAQTALANGFDDVSAFKEPRSKQVSRACE